MKTTINIAKRASGAQKDQIGDGTLFYTGEVSDFNKSLSGLFIDNPPVLSPDYASLVWRYNHGQDRYILIHVQGSQVVSEAMGRYYPFRAGYEVTRADMNRIGFDLTSLFAALPRISTMTYGRVDLETVVSKKLSVPTSNAVTLAHNIKAAIVSGRRLLVEVSPKADRSWREDGIFDCLEMNTVLSAIDSMDIKLRRYATFAFCVDENFEPVLDGVTVVFCRAGSGVQRRQDDLYMSWLEVTSRRMPLTPQQEALDKVFPYPGENEPLMTAEELLRAYGVFNKDIAALQGGDWDMWLKLGHQLTEAMPKGWKQFSSYFRTMPGGVKKQFTLLAHTPSLTWDIDGLTRESFDAVNGAQAYSEQELLTLQRKALPAHLENDEYGFLFADGVPDGMLDGLNAKYLEHLDLGSLASVERWYGIYKKHKRLKEPGVTEAFTRLLKPHAAQLTDLKQIVPFMVRYPFVPAEAYRKPAGITAVPSIRDLTDDQAALVKKWIVDEAKSHSFNSLKEVNDLLTKVKSGDVAQTIETEGLKHMDSQTLMTLLLKSDVKASQIETLLDKCKGLTKAWSGFKDMVLSTVNEFLFGKNGKWNPAYLFDVKNWDKLAVLEQSMPKVYGLVEEALVNTLDGAPDQNIDRLAGTVANYYGPLDDGSGGRETNQLVEVFIDYLYKHNKEEQAKELEDMLKLSSRRKSGTRMLVLGTLLGLVLGGVLGFMGYKMMNKGAEPDEALAKQGRSVVTFMPREKQNMMLLLASLPDSVSEVRLDSLTLSMDSVRKDLHYLQEWNKLSLRSLEKMDSARISVRPLSDVEELPADMRTVISKDFSLLEMMAGRAFKVDSVFVLGKKVAIAVPSDSLMGAQPAMSADYYFKVINYIDSHLPSEKIINLPY